MSENVLELLIQLKDEASAQLKDFQSTMKATGQDLVKVGAQVAAIGASITAAIGVTVYAAENERESVARLATSLSNVGTSYDNVKGQIDSMVASQMATTNYSNEQQLDALNSLTFTTGSYQKALELLPEALDLASAKQIDLGTASLLLGRVNDGTITQLKRMGITISDTAAAEAKNGDSTRALAEIYDKVRGSATATASPFIILKNELNETGQKIGAVLLPVLKSLVDNLIPIIQNITTWIQANPELTKEIVTVTAAMGAAILVVGTLTAAVGALDIALGLLSGPIGWIALALAGITAIGVTLYMQAQSMKDAINYATNKMTQDIHTYASAAEKAAQDVATAQINAINKALTAEQKAHDQKIQDADDEYNATIKSIDALAGAVDDQYNQQIKGLQQQKQAAQDAVTERTNNERINLLQSQINTTYDVTKKKELQKELDDFLQQIADEQAQRAIDDQISDLQDKKTANQDLATIEKQYAQEANDAKKTALDQQLTDYQTEKNNEILAIQTTNDAALAKYQEDEANFNKVLADKTKSFDDYVAAYNKELGNLGNPDATTPDINSIMYPGLSQHLNGLGLSSSHGPGTIPSGTTGAAFNLPSHASGGIITSPQIGLIGEAGPEAIIPLSQGGMGGTTYNITVNGWVGNDQQIAAKLRQELLKTSNRNATGYGG